MVFGSIEISAGVLHTHNDSYTLTPGTNVSARRPFRGMGFVTTALLTAFGISFSDILYATELWIVGGFTISCFLIGNTLAQLVVVNRDLRGSDLSVAAWGSYRHLNRIRREVAEAIIRVHGRNEA